MEYRLLASPHIRQEAQRRLRSYHEANRVRRAAVTSSCSPSSSSARGLSNLSHGACWKFYHGQQPASPGRECVDDLLAYGGESSSGGCVSQRWSPEELEHRHDYIQWLFPLRERGVNWLAPLLTTAEADAMQSDGLVMARVLQAFRMMLRFYGTCIAYTTAAAASTPQNVCLNAQLRRTSNQEEWAAQYDNLVRRSHNYLRISRIMQFLGEVGLEPLKLGWLEYLAHEVIMTGAPLAACRDSFFFWMETPFEEEDRLRLQKLVEKLASDSAASFVPVSKGPVVVVKGLFLPPTLDVARVLNEDSRLVPPAIDAAPLSAPNNIRQKTMKRKRE